MTLFSKKNILVGAGALGILATSISLFMRETVNYAKMEGDSKPAAIVKAEERVIKELAVKGETNLDVFFLVSQIDSFREEQKLCENRFLVANDCFERKNFDGALMNLQMTLTRLQHMEKDAAKLGKQQGLPENAVKLIVMALECLQEDVAEDIARFQHEKARSN